MILHDKLEVKVEIETRKQAVKNKKAPVLS
jgi:hypothetical protein